MLWQTLTDAIRTRHPSVDLQLNAAATSADIAAAEETLGVTFPIVLRDLLLAHDGQTQNDLNLSVGPEPIPPIPLGDEHESTSGNFLPLSHIVDATLANRGIAEYDVPPFGDDFELVGSVRLHRNQIVISDPGSGDIIAIDLAPPDGGTEGQIIALNHDPPAVCFIAPDLAAFFDMLADGYRTGRFSFEEDHGLLCPIVVT